MKSAIRLLLLSLFVATAPVYAAESTSPPAKSEAVAPAEKAPTPLPPVPTVTDSPSVEEEAVPPSYEGAFLKMILVLLLLLFIIFFGIWIIRRLSSSRLRMFKEPKHIRIIDRRPLSAKTALYLVEVGDKRVLVAESQLEVKRLTETDLREISPEV